MAGAGTRAWMHRTCRGRGAVIPIVIGLVAAVLVAPGPTLAQQPPSTMIGSIDVDAVTIPELQAHMDAGDLTSEALVQLYLDRIDVLNPSLNAIIALNEHALDDARAADKARADGSDAPLLGIPVLIKDNIGTTGMATTAGSYALENSMPPDAFLVTRLRDAGAIILGKANLSEWANMRSYPSSSGWSAIGGQTNNPYALDRNPCGSSSGSAVAVAASLATVAVGTETDGSIMCPASATGVVGLKPSLGLVSRSGIVPISDQQDTAGPIARNVTDAAILLAAMEGADPADPITTEADTDVGRDYLAVLDAKALDGARIGVWRAGNWGLNPPVDAIMDATIVRLEAAGATIVDPADVVVDAAYEPEFTALLCEFKHGIAEYLATLPADMPKTLQDLIDFNLAHADLEMEHFKQETFDEAQAAAAIDDPTCVQARATTRELSRSAIDSVLEANDLDAIIAPTGEPAWLTDPIAGDTFIGPYTAPPSAMAGYTTITIPVGYISGLPVGMSFIGGDRSESKLLALAYALEQEIDVRVAPTFPASVEFEGFVPPAASPEASPEPAGSIGPSFSPIPSPLTPVTSPRVTSAPAPTLTPDAMCRRDLCPIPAGTTTSSLFQPALSFELGAPATGLESIGAIAVLFANGDSLAFLDAAEAAGFRGDSTVAVGASGDAWLAYLHTLPELDLGPVEDLTVGGRPARAVTVTSDATGSFGVADADAIGFAWTPGETMRVVVVDVDGGGLVIIGEHYPTTPADDFDSTFDAIVSSVRFTTP